MFWSALCMCSALFSSSYRLMQNAVLWDQGKFRLFKRQFCAAHKSWSFVGYSTAHRWYPVCGKLRYRMYFERVGDVWDGGERKVHGKFWRNSRHTLHSDAPPVWVSNIRVKVHIDGDLKNIRGGADGESARFLFACWEDSKGRFKCPLRSFSASISWLVRHYGQFGATVLFNIKCNVRK